MFLDPVRKFFRRSPGISARAVARRAPTFRPQVCGLEERAVMDATVLYTAPFDLVGEYGGEVTGSVTVTADAPGYEGLYLWQYALHNVSYGPTAWDEVQQMRYVFNLVGDHGPWNVANWGSDHMWYNWNYGYPDIQFEHEDGGLDDSLIPGASETLWFTTDPCRIEDNTLYFSCQAEWMDPITVKGPGTPCAVGTVSGRVVLDTGATPTYPPGTPPGPNTPVVVGANVRLLDGTSVVAETNSGADGSYLFPHVPEGSYSVEVTLPAAGAFSIAVGGQQVAVGADLAGYFLAPAGTGVNVGPANLHPKEYPSVKLGSAAAAADYASQVDTLNGIKTDIESKIITISRYRDAIVLYTISLGLTTDPVTAAQIQATIDDWNAKMLDKQYSLQGDVVVFNEIAGPASHMYDFMIMLGNPLFASLDPPPFLSIPAAVLPPP